MGPHTAGPLKEENIFATLGGVYVDDAGCGGKECEGRLKWQWRWDPYGADYNTPRTDCGSRFCLKPNTPTREV